MKRASTILILCLGFQVGWGQQGFQPVGKVTDTAGIGIQGATVQVCFDRDTLSVLTDDSGAYRVYAVPQKRFRLRVSFTGFQTYEKNIALVGGPVCTLPVVVLRTAYRDLDPVIVSRTRPASVIGDTVSYHAGAFPVRDGAAVEDIMKRLPGIEVDLDGNVWVQGKKLEKVLVNGKEFFGGDVLLAIRNLPADVVDKIQVIDDFGDKARLTGIRTGEPAKILNIVLKSDKRNGYFGHGQAGGGGGDRYTGEAFANRFQEDRQLSASGTLNNNSPAGPDRAGGAAFSYADQWSPKWGGGLNGGATWSHPETSSSLTQQTYYPGQQLFLTQATHTITQNKGETGGGVFTFRPSGHSLFRLTPTAGEQGTHQVVTMISATQEEDSGFSKLSRTSAVNTTMTHAVNAGTDLYYEHTYPASRQRFSLQGNVQFTGTRQTADQRSSSYTSIDSEATYLPLHYLVSNQNTGLNLNLQGNFYSPVGTQGFLETGYVLQSSDTRVDRRTGSLDSVTGVLAPVDSLSLDNRYRTVSQNLHTGYLVRRGRINVNLTLDGQSVTLSGVAEAKGDVFFYHHFSLLPGAQGSWRFPAGRMLTLSYHASSSLPSLQEVSPVTDLTNPEYPVTGNPALKPSYTHSIGLHYEGATFRATQYRGVGGGINYSVTVRPIITSTSHPKDSSQVLQATTYVNAGQASMFGVDYHVSLPAFARKLIRVTATGSLSQGNSTTYNDQVQFFMHTLAWDQGLHVQLLIPNCTELDVEGNYVLTHTSFNSPSALPSSVQTASIQAGGKQYFLHQWSVSGQLWEQINSSDHGLASTSPALTGMLQYQFLMHNKASITLTGYNLVNSSRAAAQANSFNSVTQMQTTYTGRYFILTFALKLEKFH